LFLWGGEVETFNRHYIIREAVSLISVEQNQVERLARVETELGGIKELVVRVDSKLDAWSNTYVPRQEINEMFRSRDKEIQELKESKKDTRAMWISWVSIAIALAGMVIMIIKSLGGN
jgi:hypothetical protein